MTTTLDTKWNAGLYDDKHNFVFKFGEDVVQLLAPQQGERILDLGCGTGYLTNLIAQAGARVIGIDHSASMIGRAAAAYPDLDFRVLSATSFHFDTPFDAVFSNATLHWVLDKEQAIDNIYKALRPGGRFILEMGGKGNVEEIVVATRKVLTRHGYYSNAATQLWYFPSLGEYSTLLEKRGFRVRFASHFDRPTQLQDTDNGIKDWIKMFGNAFFKDIPDSAIEPVLDEIQEAVRPTNFRNHNWYGNYKRLRIEAIKQ
ncbi:class I SAM-dependent methyltransferase [Puia sp.]|jgi:trans-aconitate 2-methyltransferase|uniref:class I SAM-dependent methyltransferase n=1 Tax=Puia sp. TaxID=2045100 RepID=UPI002F417F6F